MQGSDASQKPQRFRETLPAPFFRGAVFLFLLCVLLAGCRKPPLTPEQTHAITKQFAAAATAASPQSTIRIARRASASSAQPDGVQIVGAFDPQTDAGREAQDKLIQALDGVAVKNDLTQDGEARSGNTVKLGFRRNGKPTHEIEIVNRVRTASSFESGHTKGARLAIILDDLGGDEKAAKEVFALPFPLTVSVLPNHPHSAEIAREAHQRGFEVMLHLPMQAMGNEKPEDVELKPGMATADVTKDVDEMLQTVPFVAGVNNHQGSQATSDQELMDELMPALRSRNLFYVDSRTTAATVAYDTAKDNGVAAGFRNVPFLDDVQDVRAIQKQLELAFKGAKEKGAAIAIGHPHPATLRALREMLPQAHAQGVTLVHASELIH